MNNEELKLYIEKKESEFNSLKRKWKSYSNEVPQKFFSLVKSGIKPTISRGESSDNRQISIGISMETNMDAAKAYIEKIKKELPDKPKPFADLAKEIDNKLEEIKDDDIDEVNFTRLASLLDSIIDYIPTMSLELGGNKIGFSISEDSKKLKGKWNKVAIKKANEEYSKAHNIDVKDVSNHKKYLSLKEKEKTAKTSAEMHTIVEEYKGLEGYLDSAKLAEAAENKEKGFKKEENLARIALAAKQQAIYEENQKLFIEAKTKKDYQAIIKSLKNQESHKKSSDLIDDCEEMIDQIEENEKKERIYKEATDQINSSYPLEVDEGIKKLRNLGDYKDAQELIAKVEYERKQVIYLQAKELNSKSDISSKQEAIRMLREIGAFEDSELLIMEAEDAIEEIKRQEEEKRIALEKKQEDERKSKIYSNAISLINTGKSEDYYKASDLLATIPDWQDSEKLISEYREAGNQIKKKEDRKKKLTIMIVVPLVLVAIIFGIIFSTKIYPEMQYNSAIDKYNSGAYKEAYVVLSKIKDYKDSGEYIDRIYDRAIAFTTEKKYDDAQQLFEVFGDYKDSMNYINKEIPYLKAVDSFEEGNIELAEELFSELTDYKETNNYVTRAIPYQRAVQLYEKGEFSSAIELFSTFGDYESTNEYIEKIKTTSLKNAVVGGCVYFGNYEQDGDKTNGTEPIEWYVLEISDNTIKVMSKYALDCLSYFNDDILTWLRNDFYNSAFSQTEAELVPSNTIRLLYSSELQSDLFVCKPTEYAKSRGVETYAWEKCYWWLYGNAKFIGKNEEIRSYSLWTNYKLGVRPVAFISIEE